MFGLQIIGTGKSLPTKIMTNDDMRQFVETSDEWIYSRTGIRQRHFCEEETNVSLATTAAEEAIANAGIAREQIGAIIVATFTADDAMPSTACMVQKALALPNDVIAFDLNAACSGFVYGMQVMEGLLQTTDKPYALLIGSEVISKVLDFTKRDTCVLFGDGAGAVILERKPEHLLQSVVGSDGNAELLHCPGVSASEQYITMAGQDVFRFAIDIIPKTIHAVLDKAGIELHTIDYFVCHQANVRILEYVAKKMKVDIKHFFMNVEHVGNTSAASIPIALAEMVEQNLLQRGMRVVMVGFGAGLTWGASVIEW